MGPTPITDFKTYIEDRSIPEPNSGCWLWLGSLRGGSNVYGYVGLAAAPHTVAHRLSYEAFKGAIPAGLCVCHRCDQPSCVNPDHLWLGTYRDNTRDMIAKRRGLHVSDPDRPNECRKGHPRNAENECYLNGRRDCRTCRLERGRLWARRKRASIRAAKEMAA